MSFKEYLTEDADIMSLRKRIQVKQKGLEHQSHDIWKNKQGKIYKWDEPRRTFEEVKKDVGIDVDLFGHKYNIEIIDSTHLRMISKDVFGGRGSPLHFGQVRPEVIEQLKNKGIVIGNFFKQDESATNQKALEHKEQNKPAEKQSTKNIKNYLNNFGKKQDQEKIIRWVPKDYIVAKKTDNGIVYKSLVEPQIASGQPVKYFAMGYSGRKGKHDWYHSFKNEEDLNKQIDQHFKNIDSWQERKQKGREERKQKADEAIKNVRVGDIYVSSFGYDQTNCSYWQIVKLIGKHTVIVREIASKIDHEDQSSEYVVPVKNQFVGKELTKRIGAYGITIDSVQSAHKWDGKPHYQTPFGMGH
jgi:DNA-binding PadR family transcriptional regulator